MGVQIGKVSEDVAKALGLNKAKGAMVSSVAADAPADDAGVQSGDVILKFNGKDITHWTDLPRMVGVTKPGTRVPMEVWRKGKVVTLSVKVGELKEPKAGSSSQESPEPAANPLMPWGLRLPRYRRLDRKSTRLNSSH